MFRCVVPSILFVTEPEARNRPRLDASDAAAVIRYLRSLPLEP